MQVIEVNESEFNYTCDFTEKYRKTKSDLDGKMEQHKWVSMVQTNEVGYWIKKKLSGLGLIPANASNAFYKAIELYSFVFPEHKMNGIHFDNASLPGDFIRAGRIYFNNYDYFAASYTGPKTLNDRFELAKKESKKWYLNLDLTDLKSITDFKGPDNVTLYTSDFGFDMDHSKLEEENHLLGCAGQILSGLNILSKGGAFIIKIFGCTTTESKTLYNPLVKCFSKMYVAKPITSRARNLELYLIGIDYNPDLSKDAKDITTSILKSEFKTEGKSKGENKEIYSWDIISRWRYTLWSNKIKENLLMTSARNDKYYKNAVDEYITHFKEILKIDSLPDIS